MSLASGTVLGPYTIAAPLGAGGPASVRGRVVASELRRGRAEAQRSTQRLISVTLNPAFGATTPTLVFDGVYEHRADTAVTFSLDPTSPRLLLIRKADASKRIACGCCSTGAPR